MALRHAPEAAERGKEPGEGKRPTPEEVGARYAVQAMFPYRDENETQRTPYVTIIIITLNVLAWLVIERAGAPLALARAVCDLGLIPGELTGTLRPGTQFPMGEGLICITDPGRQVSHVFTSMFLHGSWMHLIGNMWFLWVFGDNIEDSMGRVRFAIFYLISWRCRSPPAGPLQSGLRHPNGGRLGRHQRRHGRLSDPVPACAGVRAGGARFLLHVDRVASLDDAPLLGRDPARERSVRAPRRGAGRRGCLGAYRRLRRRSGPDQAVRPSRRRDGSPEPQLGAVATGRSVTHGRKPRGPLA